MKIPMRRRQLFILGAGVCASPAWAAGAPATGLGFDVQAWPAKSGVPAVPAADQAGQPWSLPSLRGKAVLLNFWASWCEPCRAEMPALQALAAREQAQLAVLTINLKESPEAIARFVQISGLSLPVLRDPQGDTARAWGVRIYPSTVLIDRDGVPRATVRGALDWAGAEGEALWRPLLQPARKR